MENFIDFFFLSSSLSPLVKSEDKLGKFQAHQERRESSLYIETLDLIVRNFQNLENSLNFFYMHKLPVHF